MPLLAAVRRSASRIVSGAGRPPSSAIIKATKSLDAAHADACRAWATLFARGTPSIGGAEAELHVARYFYGLATPLLARATAPSATREDLDVCLRAATSNLIDGSTAVLRATSSLPAATSLVLRNGAACYFEATATMLRASETPGDYALWFLDSSAGKVSTASSHFSAGVAKLCEESNFSTAPKTNDWDLLNTINTELETAEHSGELVKGLLDNFPFKISEKNEDSDFTLTRTYESEKIDVVVSMPNLVTGDKPDWCNYGSAAGSTQDELESTLSLTVTVTKGGTLSVFTCTALPSQIRVNSMYMRMSVGEEGKEEYEISFENSQSNQMLQVLAHRYLELRGVTLMTANFLHGLLINKGIFDNIFWLGKLKDFIKPAM